MTRKGLDPVCRVMIVQAAGFFMESRHPSSGETAWGFTYIWPPWCRWFHQLNDYLKLSGSGGKVVKRRGTGELYKSGRPISIVIANIVVSAARPPDTKESTHEAFRGLLDANLLGGLVVISVLAA
jgi:hypothetical protein